MALERFTNTEVIENFANAVELQLNDGTLLENPRWDHSEGWAKLAFARRDQVEGGWPEPPSMFEEYGR